MSLQPASVSIDLDNLWCYLKTQGVPGWESYPSYLDQVTPRSMVQLLAHAHVATGGPAFHASLPVAGESELLRNRMRYTPAQGNLHAKTGTTNTVISLAGYVTARDGEVLAFAFIYNGSDRWNARSTIDVMGATLAGFVRE